MLRGRVASDGKGTAEIWFREKAGRGYRLRLGGSAAGRLDDPARREALLARPEGQLEGAGSFVLTVDGTKFRFAWNGKPVWEYEETELSTPSSGGLRIQGNDGTEIQDVQVETRPPQAASFAERYGPGLGDRIPPFHAVDQTGKQRDFASLRGEKGLWLLFVRSADWCVFCKTQLVELGQQAEVIRGMGYEVAALTYDSPGALAHFAGRKGIAYPLLSDPDSAVIDAFGIRNENATTGFAKGVPHPGLFVVDAEGRVVSKVMEEDYKDHLSVARVLSRQFLERAAPAGEIIDRPRVRVTPETNASIVRGGQTIRLEMEVRLGRGLHAYAPGAPGEFIPVRWTVGASRLWTAGEPEWPEAELAQLYGVPEKVPNFTGTFRVTRTVTLAPQAALLRESAGGELQIPGEFRYQACNDRLCFPPETVPLSWRVLVEGQDRIRVPAELQKPDR
ncbi:MAG TPA: peroxiredoxin family protein [Bryobacteraceae bacterium]|nr:peroxiredoxin family protein [Bryobacteraceae bacterium]